MSGTQKTRYRAPRVYEEVEVSLDAFDIDDIREYLAHNDHGTGSHAAGDALVIGAEDLGRIETLAVCGQKDAAREEVLRIVGRHIGRPL